MSTQKVYPVYSFQYIQNKLVELSRQKLNTADVTPQVQADWIETDTFSPAYIKNKPTLPATIGDVVGPSSSITGNIVLFDGSTGKLIKDSGNNLSQFQYNISLTTTGSSGAATFIANVLNIPTPTLAGLGGITLSSLSASSPLAYNNTTGVFSIQVASSTQNGYLSSTDWNTFNNKQSALGFTAVPTTRTLTINGTTYDLSADRTWTISSGGMSNPMTTAGDMIYGGTSGTPTRLGIGTSGYVLQAGATAPTWFNLFGTANSWTATQTFNPSVTASGALARAMILTSTLTAAANNDLLVGLDINPTYSSGAFTGVKHMFIRTPTTNASTSRGGIYIGGNNFAGGTDVVNSPDIQIGMSTTQYTSINFTQQATYGQLIYGVTGSYIGFIFNIGGTTNYAYRFNWSANGRQSSFGQESTVLHSYKSPDYCEFYLRMRAMNDNTRYFRITTDNASQVDTLRFAIQGFANSSLAYFTNIAGVGFNVTSPTALVHIGASTTTASALRFASGVAPTTPNDGDIWYDGTNLNFKLPGLLFTNNSGSINTHLTSYVNTAANGNLVQWISNNSANTVTYSAFRQLIAGSGNGYGMLSLAVNQAATGTTLTPYLTADGQWKTLGIFVNTQIGATASTNGILSSAAKSTLDVIGSLSTAVVAKTATYTATISDHTILCNATTGAITINLPAASGIAGREYVIKKTDSSVNAVTVDANASETIDGALTYTLSLQNKYVFIQTDGTSWYVIANN